MIVEFLSRFGKDLEKVNDALVLTKLSTIIAEVKIAEANTEISNLKKLIGYKNAY